MVKYLRLAGIAFVIFYVLKSPAGAAGTVNEILGGLESAGGSLATFINGIG